MIGVVQAGDDNLKTVGTNGRKRVVSMFDAEGYAKKVGRILLG